MIIRHKNFKKQHKKLQEVIKEKFNQKIKLFYENKFNPILNNHQLHGKWIYHRSINITGDIRAIYKEEGNSTIFVAIDSHPNLYG